MFRLIISWLLVCIIAVQAQDPLENLAKQMPQCSLACFLEEYPLSACATNATSTCLCNDDAFNLAVAVCSKKTCTRYELLQTKNVSSISCGLPVRDKSGIFFPVSLAGAVIVVVAFLLRMAAGLGEHGRQASWDDATMALVVAFSLPLTPFSHYMSVNGLGRDIWTLSADHITNVLKYYYLGEIFYVLSIGISKISILLLYLRVFPSKSFRTLVHGVMGLSVAYTITFFFVTVFQCRPISLAWNQWDGLHEGHCHDIRLQVWSAAAINIVLDATVMVLPMKYLAMLNMSLKKKIMVMSMFGVGIFVIVVSIIRLYSLIHFANTENITWNYLDTGIWSIIEVNVSIVCGCMPAFRPLIARMWPKFKTTGDSSKGSSSKLSRYIDNIDPDASTNNKTARVSIRRKERDDDDFIPLNDVGSDNARVTLTKEGQDQRQHANRITQTHTIAISHQERSAEDRSQDWNSVMTGKEHV